MNLDEVQLGEIRYDPTSRSLSLESGAPVRLRNKSKDVLGYLLKNANRTVTKDELIENVWRDVFVTDDSLVQCIADIRRVIGPDAKNIVETIPREGYRLHLGDQGPKKRRSFVFPLSALVLIGFAAMLFWSDRGGIRTSGGATLSVQADGSVPGTNVPEAYLEVLQGRISANRFNFDESLVAERHFRKAIELDPSYARAHAELGALFAVRFENNWVVLAAADKDKAFYYAENSLVLDPDNWLGHYALGRLHSVFAEFEESEAHLQTAMSLEPENEDARAYFATVRLFQGDAEQAIAILDPVLKSHPNPPYWYYLSKGHALMLLRDYDEAESALMTCLSISDKSPYCLRYLMALYGETGRFDKAIDARRDYASTGFEPSVSAIVALFWDHPEDIRLRLASALRISGLPE